MPPGKTTPRAELLELQELRERYANVQTRLQQSEHIIQRINTLSTSIVYVFDIRAMRTIFVNRTMTTLLGHTLEDLQALGERVMPYLIHPEDRPRFALHAARLRELPDDEVALFEHRARDRAGNWHWFEARDAVFLRDAAGSVQQIVGTAALITARKQSQFALRAAIEQFQAAAMQQPVALFRQDLQLRYSWVHGSIAGFGAAELVGKRDRDVLERRSDALAIDRLKREVIRSGVGARRTVGILAREIVHHYDLVVAPVPDASARACELMCAAIDLTSSRLAHEALAQSM